MARHPQQEYAIASCWESSALNTRRENELFTGSALVVNNHLKYLFTAHSTTLDSEFPTTKGSIKKMCRFYQNAIQNTRVATKKKRNLGFSSPILAHNPAQKISSDYLQPHIGTLADKLLIYSSRNQQRLPTAPKRRGSKQL